MRNSHFLMIDIVSYVDYRINRTTYDYDCCEDAISFTKICLVFFFSNNIFSVRRISYTKRCGYFEQWWWVHCLKRFLDSQQFSTTQNPKTNTIVVSVIVSFKNNRFVKLHTALNLTSESFSVS